jgi:hexosaminidase
VIVPKPQEAARRTAPAGSGGSTGSPDSTDGGWFELDDATVLDADTTCVGAAAWLRGAIGPATGLALRVDDAATSAEKATSSPATPPSKAIRFRVVPGGLPAEGYRLTVHVDGVQIEAADAAGAFYAAQSLRALLPAAAYRNARISAEPWRIPATAITDWPRFPWRGAMLDVARHFLPRQDVLRFIDLIALHKINVLHLHLTDDQGWRLEIKRFPRLTEVGGWRRESPIGDRRHGRFDGRPHGGFYTQDDVREIVAYAADRHVTVVPEIDVPGHAGAAIAAYPELGLAEATQTETPTHWGINDYVLNAEASTLEFFKQVFDEVMDLFPSRHIGVGGDECPTEPWSGSARTRERMAELGLTAPDKIRFWYVARLAEHLAARGRSLYGWDEICDGDLPPGAVVASWRGTAGAVTAARLGHDVVLCPEDQVYLDYRQSESLDEPVPVGTITDLARVHAFTPIPEELTEAEAAHVLGAQCTVWTEHMDSARAVDYMAFPRLCAFAETVWTGPGQDYDGFLQRMSAHERRLDALGVEYRRATGPLPWQSRPDAPGWPR